MSDTEILTGMSDVVATRSGFHIGADPRVRRRTRGYTLGPGNASVHSFWSELGRHLSVVSDNTKESFSLF